MDPEEPLENPYFAEIHFKMDFLAMIIIVFTDSCRYYQAHIDIIRNVIRSNWILNFLENRNSIDRNHFFVLGIFSIISITVDPTTLVGAFVSTVL